MKPIYINMCVALAAGVVGAVMGPWMGSSFGAAGGGGGAGGSASGGGATKAFVMPASMPAVAEPAAITAQRAALMQPGQGKKPVLSTVINVAKLASKASSVGSRRDLFDGPTVTLNNMEGHISVLNPGELSHAPHQHINEEMVILMEGTVEVTING
ncbi:MAG TPA: hypothetical protein VGN88_01680, partial [Phycisphaerae bacterium]